LFVESAQEGHGSEPHIILGLSQSTHHRVTGPTMVMDIPQQEVTPT
jgi:hypothetical protein